MSKDADLLPAGLRVLLVEDEPLIAIDGQDILRSLGVGEVMWARTLADGLKALDAKQFDAAVLDVRLGMETSFPIAQRLATLDVPFGFLTGFQDDAIPQEFKDRLVVAKPFTPEQLGMLLLALVGQD